MSTRKTTGAGRTVASATLERPLDARGYPQPIATTPGHHAGRVPGNKGRRYEPDPPSVEEIAALLAHCGDDPLGWRMQALIVLLWRVGLRISEALALTESDLHPDDGSIIVRHGKGDRRRIAMLDPWGWRAIKPWLDHRRTLEVGPVLCILVGPTTGTRAWDPSDARSALHRLARRAGVRKRVAPHQLRHAHAVELWREGIDLLAVQRQLGHARLDVTEAYLRSLSPQEVLAPIGRRPAPVVPL